MFLDSQLHLEYFDCIIFYLLFWYKYFVLTKFGHVILFFYQNYVKTKLTALFVALFIVV